MERSKTTRRASCKDGGLDVREKLLRLFFYWLMVLAHLLSCDHEEEQLFQFGYRGTLGYHI